MSNSSSKRYREELLRMREQLQRMDPILTSVRTKLQDQFERLAGPILPKLLGSRSSAESYLDDPNPKNRCAALYWISYHWGANEQFAVKCEAMIRGDSDPEVRSCAVSCLAAYYAKSNDTKIGRIIAGLVLDESEPVMVREAAYRALFDLRGLPGGSWPGFTRFRFPEDVDWSFVNSFSEKRKKGEEEKRGRDL